MATGGQQHGMVKVHSGSSLPPLPNHNRRPLMGQELQTQPQQAPQALRRGLQAGLFHTPFSAPVVL